MLLLLAACQQDPTQGTAVGNPTGLAVDTAPGSTVGFSSASAKVESVEQTSCNGTATTIPLGQTVDLLGATHLTLGTGEFCSLTLHFGGPIQMAGTAGGHALNLALTVAEVKVGAAKIAPGEYLLELGKPGWVDALEKDLEDDDVTIADGDARHNALVAAIRTGSTLYRDQDRDGKVDDDERKESSAEAEEDHQGSGTVDASTTEGTTAPMTNGTAPRQTGKPLSGQASADTDGTASPHRDDTAASPDPGATSAEPPHTSGSSGSKLAKTEDTGAADTGAADTGTSADTGDTGNTDTGDTDTGDTDTGDTDTGSTDTGDTDTGSTDTGSTDTGDTDTGSTDTGDTGSP